MIRSHKATEKLIILWVSNRKADAGICRHGFPASRAKQSRGSSRKSELRPYLPVGRSTIRWLCEEEKAVLTLLVMRSVSPEFPEVIQKDLCRFTVVFFNPYRQADLSLDSGQINELQALVFPTISQQYGQNRHPYVMSYYRKYGIVRIKFHHRSNGNSPAHDESFYQPSNPCRSIEGDIWIRLKSMFDAREPSLYAHHQCQWFRI